jgi:zinc protease
MSERTARLSTTVILAAALVGHLPAGAQTIQLPEVHTVDLENGLRVVIAEQHTLPLVEVHLRMPAGSAMEPAEREGLATFTAELLTQGTASRSATEIAETLDRIGAVVSAGSGRDDLRVSLSVLARHHEAALALLADCVSNSVFPETEVERMRTRLLTNLQQEADDAETLADIALWRTRFPGQPYGRRLEGSESSLKAITAAELRSYHRSRLVPAGSALAVVGDFDTDTMLGEIRALFGDWRGEGESPALLPEADDALPAPAPGSPILIINRPGLAQTQVRLAYPGLPRGHPDGPALTVAASILGGGFTSRLLQAIRVERSLSYVAHCYHRELGRAGLVGVATFTKIASTREVVDVALDEISRFREGGPTAEELAGNVSYLSGIVARGLQSPAGLAENLSLVAFYGLPEDYLERRIERYRAVSIDDVRRVTAEHLDPSHAAFVFVTDLENVRGALDGLGASAEMHFEMLLQ